MKETKQTQKMKQKIPGKAIFEIVYENYGLNGENPEGDVIIVNVISKNIERAIAKFTKLQARQTQMLDEIMNAQVGKIHSVYFDELKSNGRIAGRSDDGKLVFVKGSEELLGKIADVKITKASRGSLDGEVVDA